MTLLVSGLILFLITHSISIFNPNLRQQLINKLGNTPWKLLYSAISVIALLMVVYGYGEARQTPVWVWNPPVAFRHLALLLTLFAFILLAAAYIPRSSFKARLGHPMLMSVKVWALAHLMANGTLADILLFGSFLAWGVAGFVVHRRRDRQSGTIYPAATWQGNAAVVSAGLVSWAVFAMFLHTLLIGVSPMP